jgi:hypothetical protein
MWCSWFFRIDCKRSRPAVSAKAVRLRPDDADAHANLGSALAELGHFAEAKAQFERARLIQIMLWRGKILKQLENVNQ